MPIFLDSSNLNEIEKYYEMGVIRGVTTNPTIMVKDGFKSFDEIKARTIQIAELLDEYPVSVEVLSNEPKQMIKQAKEFSNWSKNINIKIPFHGPNGELDNLKVIKELTNYGIDINCTAIMNTTQCITATLAGARYVSLFGGRVNDMGYNSKWEIRKIRRFLDNYHYTGDTELIIGSVREALNISEWLHYGADIITVPPNILEKSLIHARTKETVKMFLDDAEKLKKAIK